MLKDKTIVLGVTGGIAAYKAAFLASALMKQHANVHVIMTEHATEFIAPLTFETYTHNRCILALIFINSQLFPVRIPRWTNPVAVNRPFL